MAMAVWRKTKTVVELEKEGKGNGAIHIPIKLLKKMVMDLLAARERSTKC